MRKLVLLLLLLLVLLLYVLLLLLLLFVLFNLVMKKIRPNNCKNYNNACQINICVIASFFLLLRHSPSTAAAAAAVLVLVVFFHSELDEDIVPGGTFVIFLIQPWTFNRDLIK